MSTKLFFSTCLLYSATLFDEKNCKKLFFAIYNFIQKIAFEGDYYSYCEKYSGCAWQFGQTNFCPICKIKLDFTETEADFARFNWELLKNIANRLNPYLTEILQTNELCDDIFNLLSPVTIGEFFYSIRDNTTGIKTETSLTDMLQMYSDRVSYNNFLMFKYDCLTFEEYKKYTYKDS